jgi:hypothetical protein
VTDKLDASDQGVAEALANSGQQEVVVGTQYKYWNQVPSRPPPGGGDTYSASVGDVLTFRYGSDDNVILMATEPDGSSPDWESCTNFPQGAQVGRQTLDNAASDYYDVGLRNVYHEAYHA